MTLIDWIILILAVISVVSFVLVKLFGKNKKPCCGGDCACCSVCKNCVTKKDNVNTK